MPPVLNVLIAYRTSTCLANETLRGHNASVKDSYGASQYDVDKSKNFPLRQQGVFMLL